MQITEDRVPASRSAVYNSRNPKMLSFLGARWAWFILLLFSQALFAADWHIPEAQLTEKIAAITGPGVIALEITNRSSISSPDVELIRRDLLGLLSTSGIRVWQADQAAATIKLTLSENVQNYVWVVQVQQANNESAVAIVSTPRPDSAINLQSALPLVLRATPLISRPEPILDAALLSGSPRRMLVLGTTAVTIYENKEGRWLPGQSLPINSANPLPRDARGRILLRKDHLFDAFLPELICRASNAMTMACDRSDDPWPLQTEADAVFGFFSPARNFFTGALSPGIGKQKSAPPFYSGAAVPKPNYTLWIVSGLDGQTYLLDGINQQLAARTHWGSDIGGVRAGCRSGAQVVATLPDDQQDTLQAFEFPDREPAAVSQRLQLNGNVTALWTAQDEENITAIIRNSETGNYEALQLNLACSQ